MVRETGKPDMPLKHVLRHSPDGFEWGYGGSGPADLALAILREVFCIDPKCKELADKYYLRFKVAVVQKLPRDQFEITEAEIRQALTGIVGAEIRDILT